MGTDRPTSRTLLERVRSHDQLAWHRLVNLYAPLVGYWCRRWGLRGADVDDVRQDVFGALATALPSFRTDQPNASFRGWLRGITRHKLLEHQRRHGRHPQAQGGTAAQFQFAAVPDATDPTEDDPPEELSDLYHRALELVRSEFEVKTWQMFWRAAVENHPVDLIAADEGVSAAAVRKAKSRVLRRLKAEVGDLLD
jgi:RNA polymerase sigma-70 factor, ECF subfamily